MGIVSSLVIVAKLPQHHSGEYQGIPIVIEWPKGCTREGKDQDGKTWRREMKADYGFIDDTTAAGDKEPLDIYIGDQRKSDRVFVIEQLKEDGSFDEYKLVTGVPDLEAAQDLYLAHYPQDWAEKRLGDVYESDMGKLKEAVEEHQGGLPGRKEATLKEFKNGKIVLKEQGVEVWLAPRDKYTYEVHLWDQENRFGLQTVADRTPWDEKAPNGEALARAQLEKYLPVRGQRTSWNQDDAWLRKWKAPMNQSRRHPMTKL